MNARRNNRATRRAPQPARLKVLAGPGLRLLAGMAMAGMLVLLAAAWVHFDPEAVVPIGQVEIVGDPQHADVAAIRERALHHVPGFVGTDLERLRDELEAMPWVDGAQLRRRWPDTLEIRITEPVPVAQWGEDRLVDRHGRLFGPVALEDWSFLPALSGQDGRQVVLMQRYLEVSARLADAGFEVIGLEEGRRHEWTIHLADGAKVLMGRDAELARLGLLVHAAPAIRTQRDAPVARIDLRYPHGLAVAWAGEAGREAESAGGRR